MISDSKTVLRRTSPEDFTALRSMFDLPAFSDWGGPSRRTDAEIRAKYLGARSPRVDCYLVLLDGQAAGLAQLVAADNAEQHGGLDLILVPAARGQGLGRRVVDEMVRLARERGWTRLTVDPDPSNLDGIAFWKAVGFTDGRTVTSDPDRPPFLLLMRATGDRPERDSKRHKPGTNDRL